MFLEYRNFTNTFAGPYEGHMYLVVVDAHSKWPEVCVMDSTTSTKTIQVLKTLFSRYGLPEVLVIDNGPQFTSEEFQTFLKVNGVKHTFCTFSSSYEWLGGTHGSDSKAGFTLFKRINFHSTKVGHLSTGVSKHPARHHKGVTCYVVSTS